MGPCGSTIARVPDWLRTVDLNGMQTCKRPPTSIDLLVSHPFTHCSLEHFVTGRGMRLITWLMYYSQAVRRYTRIVGSYDPITS